MKTLDIVFGDSSYNILKKINLKDSDILKINILFNVGDLSNISNYIINIPKDLCFEEKNYYIKDETDKIIDSINRQYKIRVWTSHIDIYSYLIMLYVSSIVKKHDYQLYVIYCDEYKKDYPSISTMKIEEVEKLVFLEHKLENEEIKYNCDVWKKLIRDNSELRIIENEMVKSVSLNYYDKYILDILSKIGKVKISQLIGKLMQKVYLQDNLYKYLINNLIKNGRIIIYRDNKVRYCDNLISVNV